MPPSHSTLPSDADMPSLLVTWRSEKFTIPAPPSLTVAELKSRLSALTNVPSDRQKLLFPSAKSSKDDSQPLSALFRDGKLPTRPIMLLGTPAAAQQDQSTVDPDAEQPHVVDDLDELLIPPQQPVAPPSRRYGTPRRQQSVWQRLSPEMRQRLMHSIEPSASADAAPSEPSGPPQEDASATNGATLSLETLDEGLRGAQTGSAFIAEHMAPAGLEPWDGADGAGILDAVSRSRQRLRMLAVVMFDFVGASEASEKLLTAMAGTPGVRGVLDRAFDKLPMDLGSLEDGGAGLLRRLGLHAAPVVIVLGDVGVGVSIVDMFNTEWFGDVEGEEGATALAMRFEETLANFDGFYGAARARREVGDDREQMIREQDEALQAATAADREREEMEKTVAEEARRREEQEERERRRREEEEDMERRKHEEETEEARSQLPREPEAGGAKVVLRMPDGRRIERAFEETDCVRDVFNLAIAEGARKGKFVLRAMFPRRVFTDHDGDGSLKAAGFVPSAILNVED